MSERDDSDWALQSLSDRVLEDIDRIFQRSELTPAEFGEKVRAWFGDDFLEIYTEWIEEGES